MSDSRILIITGMSGAGKTQVMRTLEDLNYFCVDNLPPALIPKFAELCMQTEGKVNRIAFVIDIRGGEFFEEMVGVLDEMKLNGTKYELLFLDASDEVLIRRYKETRRRHPLANEGSLSHHQAHHRQPQQIALLLLPFDGHQVHAVFGRDCPFGQQRTRPREGVFEPQQRHPVH